MTQTEHYNHLLVVLVNHQPHTIVRHTLPSGAHCYRIRDKDVNPIANMPESIFYKLRENNLLTQINQREWQLNKEQLSLQSKGKTK